MKLTISLIVFAVIAVSLSRKVRLSNRYERSDKTAREISDWKALDQGIDPTMKQPPAPKKKVESADAENNERP